jgi:hypothetical protein
MFASTQVSAMSKHAYSDEELLQIAQADREAKTIPPDPSEGDPCRKAKENVRTVCGAAGSGSQACKDALKALANCMDAGY